MQVAIVSNCQGESLGLCLKALNSGFYPTFILASSVLSSAGDLKTLVDAQIIFCQPSTQGFVPPEFQSKVVLFPSIAFSGLHPDITYARGRRKDNGNLETINTPMSSYNSGIALFGYKMGFTIQETLGHYTSEVFNRLGYFNAWEAGRQDLLAEGLRAGIPLGELFAKWTRRGAFMYSFNHPDIAVMADVALALMDKIGIPAVNRNVAQYLHDPLKAMPVWPIYPQIAARHGLQGDASFVCVHTNTFLSLHEYVVLLYSIYDQYDRDTLEPLNYAFEDYKNLLGFGPQPPSLMRSTRNPYAGAPKSQFWKDSVAGVEAASLDPVVNPSFVISLKDKVATAGSCFAQHIARTLARSGFNYFVPEQAPPHMTEDEAKLENYGVFSARYGNIYTVRQLVQLLDRIEGRFTPYDSAWKRRDGRLVDPFRPQISAAGYETEAELLAARDAHFEAVRRLFSESNVFVFTLGLTEGWRSKIDGAVFPLAPGVAGGEMDFERYEFINFNYDEVVADLHKAVERIQAINPKCRIILTISPVPLIATYEPRHALVATTYSKSVLRAAADAITRYYGHVEYFPSYEIITGSYNYGAYYEDDLRSVKEEGVAHVMRIFMTHYAEGGEAAPVKSREVEPSRVPSKLFDIVCDEEAIAKLGH